MLIRYARKKNRHPIGVVVADIKDGKLRIGWSKCHLSLDRWNRKEGLRMAVARLDRHGERLAKMTRTELASWTHEVEENGITRTAPVVPDSLHDIVLWMQEKATWNLLNKGKQTAKPKKTTGSKKAKKSKKAKARA